MRPGCPLTTTGLYSLSRIETAWAIVSSEERKCGFNNRLGKAASKQHKYHHAACARVVLGFFPGLFMGHDPARASDHEVLENPTDRTGLLGQEVLETPRVGSGRVRRFSNFTGQGRVTLTRSDPRKVIRPVQKKNCFFFTRHTT